MRCALVPLLMSLAFASPALAQAGASVPRTPDGKPDFQGVWTNASITKLERVPEFNKLVLTPEEAKTWEASAAAVAAADSAPTDPSKGAPKAGEDPEGYNFFWIEPGTEVGKVKGEYRSSWIVDPPDGRVPYSAEGRAAMMKSFANMGSFDNPEERISIERCLVGFGSVGGPPMLNAIYNNHHRIIQTKDTIAINVEMIHDTRIIQMADGSPSPVLNRFLGTSNGRWDGDTLIVETTGFQPIESLRVDWGMRVFIPPQAKVTERFTLTSADEILYEFTVEDPKTYTQPWKGELVFRRSKSDLYEYACHEGNYSVHNILAGARAMEREGRTSANTRPRARLDR